MLAIYIAMTPPVYRGDYQIVEFCRNAEVAA